MSEKLASETLSKNTNPQSYSKSFEVNVRLCNWLEVSGFLTNLLT